MNQLSKIWKDQKAFNENFIGIIDKLTLDDKQHHTKQYILETFSEMNELLREINFKMHRPADSEIIESNMMEEWIDIFKYWLSIGLVWGWTPEQFVEEYMRKSRVVEQRYIQEHASITMLKIILVDIDGVLADYPASFKNFIRSKTDVWLNTSSYQIYDEYAKVLGRDKLEKLKHEYRINGYKRYLPVLPYAKKFLDHFYKNGYSIILLTSRPYKKYKRMFADTIFWLKKNGLKYHSILWDEEKDYGVIKNYLNAAFMVEDNLNFAINVAKLGVKVYLLDKPYNQSPPPSNIEIPDRIIRVKSLNEVLRWEQE